MDINESIVRLIIETAKERSVALSLELEKAEERQYPSEGPSVLIRALQEINKSVALQLEAVENDKDLFSLLTPQQIQQRVYRYIQLLPYLHELLGLLDGAEIKDTPAPIVPSLRQLLREYLPDAELVLASKTSLNYSFVEISSRLKELLNVAGLASSAASLPEHFVVITFPRVEVRNVLLHCVIAHEIGHGLYQNNKASGKLLPLIKIDKRKITHFANVIFQAELKAAQGKQKDPTTLPLYPTENEIRARLTLIINTTLERWLEELSSDAIGFLLFGPAYLFALIHLVISFQLIDNASLSHPPNRLRVHLLLLMIGEIGNQAVLDFSKNLPPKLRTFIEQWKSICTSLTAGDPIFEIIVKSIKKVLKQLSKLSKDIVGDRVYKNAPELIASLCELIVNGVPPIELMNTETKSFDDPNIIYILNAGWQVLISDMDSFANFYGGVYESDKAHYKVMLSNVILKAIELKNVKGHWEAHA